MTKKEIIELRSKIVDAKSKVSKLEKLLQDNAGKEFELLTPRLNEQKNNLLIEIQLGADKSHELAQIEERIIDAVKIDHKNKDEEAKRGDFIKTIQARIDAEKEDLSGFIDQYKTMAIGFLLEKVAEKENEIKLNECARSKLIIEADAIESAITIFDGGKYASISGITDNKERVFELWRTKIGGHDTDPLEIETQKEFTVLMDYLKKQGIEEITQ